MPPEFWRFGTLCALAAVGLFGGLGTWAATVAAGVAAALHALAWRRARKRRRRLAATEFRVPPGAARAARRKRGSAPLPEVELHPDDSQ